MNSSYILSIGFIVYDAAGNRSASPPFSANGPANFSYSQGTIITPGATYSFFDGTRVVTADTTTVLTMTLSPINVDPIYRFTWTGGTALGMRTARSLDLSGQSVAMALNANETVSMTASPGAFGAVLVGDLVFIPSVSTGDPVGPFSEPNAGLWVVLSKSSGSSSVQLARLASAAFSGLTETVTVASIGQVLAYSPGPVQIGDWVRVVAGFSAPIMRAYQVTQVTADWFEVVTSDPLPLLEISTPGAVPVVFYSSAKSLIWLQCDQESTFSLNGAAAQPLTLPQAGTPATLVMTGPVYSLSVTNRAVQPMQAFVQGAS